jgi:hypothetical protein
VPLAPGVSPGRRGETHLLCREPFPNPESLVPIPDSVPPAFSLQPEVCLAIGIPAGDGTPLAPGVSPGRRDGPYPLSREQFPNPQSPTPIPEAVPTSPA